MFQVNDVWEESLKISGICDESKILRWLSDAVTLVSNKMDLEGWKGFIDICTANGGTCFSLPREVETVYGVNIGGRPTLGLGQLFNFHLNGPGDCCPAKRWSWQDGGGAHSTYRDIVTPAKLICHVERPEDAGKELVVYGYDKNGHKLRRQKDGSEIDGLLIPTIYGYAVTEDDAPEVARITGVYKAPTVGVMRLSTMDNSGSDGVLLSVYEPDEQHPQYRRIVLGQCASWIRVAYRRTNPVFTSRYDRVPLKSRIAFLMAMRAVKSYNETNIPMAHTYEADAARLELEAQNATEAPTYTPVQVLGGANDLVDKCDYDIR